MAADMAALLEGLDIPAAVIGGVSMGAGIALKFGTQYKSRTRALILSRPAWLNEPNPPNLAVIASIADLIERHGRERALPLFENSEVYTSLNESFPHTAGSLKETFSAPGIEASVSGFRSILASAPFDSFEDCSGSTFPPWSWGTTATRSILSNTRNVWQLPFRPHGCEKFPPRQRVWRNINASFDVAWLNS
jgi:pimeloyl-ACP methyl ester carboxylesterase